MNKWLIEVKVVEGRGYSIFREVHEIKNERPIDVYLENFMYFINKNGYCARTKDLLSAKWIPRERIYEVTIEKVEDGDTRINDHVPVISVK